MNGAEETIRTTNQESEEKEFGAANDGVGHAAAGLANGNRQFGKKAPAHGGSAMINKVAEDEKQHRNGNESAHACHRQHEAAYEFAPAQPRTHACPVPPPRCEVATISKRANPFKMKVRIKSTRPSSMRASVYKAPVASVNSLAMTAAME